MIRRTERIQPQKSKGSCFVGKKTSFELDDRLVSTFCEVYLMCISSQGFPVNLYAA